MFEALKEWIFDKTVDKCVCKWDKRRLFVAYKIGNVYVFLIKYLALTTFFIAVTHETAIKVSRETVYLKNTKNRGNR